MNLNVAEEDVNDRQSNGLRKQQRGEPGQVQEATEALASGVERQCQRCNDHSSGHCQIEKVESQHEETGVLSSGSREWSMVRLVRNIRCCTSGLRCDTMRKTLHR